MNEKQSLSHFKGRSLCWKASRRYFPRRRKNSAKKKLSVVFTRCSANIGTDFPNHATLAKINEAGEKLQNIGSSVENVGKKFLPVTAAASSNANTNVSMMGKTFKYCAPIAGALGFSAEDS